jgi:ribosomal protein L6P/L9E
MSRVAKAIVTIPAGVDVSINADSIKVKGKGGDLSLALNAWWPSATTTASCRSLPQRLP